MNKKKISLVLSLALITNSIIGTAVFAATTNSSASTIIKPLSATSTSKDSNTSSAGVKIDNKIVTIIGTVVSKPTNDGVAYYLVTSDGTFGLIGPNAKSLISYANTDKKITVTGNPAVGVNILVVSSFSDYIQPTATTVTSKATTSTSKNTSTNTSTSVIKIDNKVVNLTGTVASKPTNDGIAYYLVISDGSFGLIGANAKSLSSYANTDKKVTVTGNPAAGVNILVVNSFSDYIPPSVATVNSKPSPSTNKDTSTSTSKATTISTSTSGIKIDNKVVSITGTVVSKPTTDGVTYYLLTSDGSNIGLIGPNAKSLISYANTDKKITVTGNPAVGVNVLVVSEFKSYTPEASSAKPVVSTKTQK